MASGQCESRSDLEIATTIMYVYLARAPSYVSESHTFMSSKRGIVRKTRQSSSYWCVRPRPSASPNSRQRAQLQLAFRTQDSLVRWAQVVAGRYSLVLQALVIALKWEVMRVGFPEIPLFQARQHAVDSAAGAV